MGENSKNAPPVKENRRCGFQLKIEKTELSIF